MWDRMREPVNVLVWLAEPLLRAGVRSTLREAGIEGVVVGLATSVDDRHQVVVTDWSSGVCMAQRSAVPGLPSLRSDARILVIASRAREYAVASALRSGIHGLVLSSCTAAELVLAVRSLADGASYICPDVARRVAAGQQGQQLTAREDEVLRLLARGHCNKAIARQLGIAVGTVKTHVKGVLAKLGASSRTEAASIAAQKGIVEIPEFRGGRSAGQDVD